MEELHLDFADLKELYRCYMPAMKNGALFVRTARPYKMGHSLALRVTLPDALDALPVSGKVVWITPQNAHSAQPAGIGIVFIDDKYQLQDKIEKLLSGMLESHESTYSL